MVDVKSRLPTIYDGIKETDELTSAADHVIGIIADEAARLKANAYVQTADDEGLTVYEGRFGIISDPILETIEFRRARIINRLSVRPPFTLDGLIRRLNAIIGKDRYNIAMDYASHTLTLEALAENLPYSNEIQATVSAIKPATVVFISKPMIVFTIKLRHNITATKSEWQYRAGTTARASYTTPLLQDIEGATTMSNAQSITPELLNDTLEAIQADIVTARINDTYEITTLTKTVNGDYLAIEYVIDKAASGLAEITNIKLLNASDEILAETNGYIPFTDTVTVKHKIYASEGVK